jgi:Ricin-type beta-trefoil lectin domain-like
MSGPADGVKMKIWQCYDNLPAQQWDYSIFNRITLANTGMCPPFFILGPGPHGHLLGLCLDLTDGNTANGNRLQTWTCSDNNSNQLWSHQY